MSSLKSLYQNFLARPNAAVLSNHASLHYITTLTTINSAAAILKHFVAHQQVLKKKQEKVLSTVEGESAICLDVETTLEFITGGGAYLPGLDDNFLSDRVVTFPMVHIVHFDSDQKIQTIRLYWDQGSLLKLVDVIGARARNWPIRDGKDQARLIASSAAHSQTNEPISDTRIGSRDQNARVTNQPVASSKNVTGDPHASLSLFAPRDTNNLPSHQPAAVATRISAKPPPRDYQDLFASNESDGLSADARVSSPQKENRGLKAQSAKPPPRDYSDLFVGNESENTVPGNHFTPNTKGGAGKNFQPSRLFDTDNSQPGTPGTPVDPSDKFIKPHPSRYNHFELGAGNETDKGAVLPRPKTKHQSQWDFEDFMTPEKVPQKIRDQDVRHFGWSDDEPNMDSPVKHPKVTQARPDARTHFDFQDEGTPAGDRAPANHPRGQGNNKGGMGLYKNDLFEHSERSPSPQKKSHPLSTVTNLKDRHQDLDPHFAMTDDSPGDAGLNGTNKPIPESRSKAVKMMEAQWEASDRSLGPPAKTQAFHNNADRSRSASTDKENDSNAGNNSRHLGIKSGGDGMGGKKGAGRSWGFGDESDEDGQGGINGGKFRAGKKQQAPKDSAFWDF